MVRERYGLALIDQPTPLDPGLVTRPIAGINWTADTAFVYSSGMDHVAIPFDRTLPSADLVRLETKQASVEGTAS